MERTVSAADAMLTDPETGAPLLDGMPRQRVAPSALAAPAAVPGSPVPCAPVPAAGPRPWLLLPTPKGTPFTFAYAAVLVATSLFARYAAPALTHALYRASSTDVAHLVHDPVQVLVASALWIAGGITSTYTLVFLLVLTALERRIGARRAAAVFLSGHVLATLVTEGFVGLAVLAGRLPATSLHRLDYGISFGVAASLGALTGLMPPWLRWPVLISFAAMLLQGLAAFADPMSDWGHVLSLAIGVALWPVVRGWQRGRPVAARVPAGVAAAV
ncbi:rhomboid-like protein [Streptomyces sp. NPDC048664]|uniref:rhomboid-like protein n=1 Tax=Streptomyces sp. NPDC048664 TaxID=3154505 RepID=UPI0034214D52